jgi:hypothetical protein
MAESIADVAAGVLLLRGMTAFKRRQAGSDKRDFGGSE